MDEGTLICLLMTLPALSCGGPVPEPEPVAEQAAVSVHRGLLVLGHEARSFTPCGGETDLWVVDASPDGELRTVYDELTSEPYEPIYAEVVGEIGPPPEEGFGAEYDRQITVRELRRAVLEGPGCEEDLTRFEFRALGNEPFWSVLVGASGIEFFEPSGSIGFPYRPPEVAGEARSYSSASGTPPVDIRLDLRPGRCADTMSGARFPYRATVRIDGREMDGCAYEGRPGSAAGDPDRPGP